MSDRILVTGGAGFIGSHASERLADDGREVWVLDNFDDHYSPALKRRNVAGLVSRPSVHLVEGDVRDAVLLGGLFTDVEFDAVVHLAARPGVPASVDDPDACYEVNVRGALRVMEAMVRHDVVPIVLASSSPAAAPTHSVSGTATVGVAEPDLPATPHAASQRSAELLAHAYHRTHGLSVHCLRLSAVYGPRQRPDQLFHRLARRLAAGERPPLRDEGNRGDTARDHLYVDDAVAALCLSLERLLASDGPVWQTVDVPGSERLTPEEASSALAAAMEVPHPANGDRPEPASGTSRSAPVPEDLPEFRPEVGLEEGLARFVAWLRSEDASVNGDSEASAARVTPPRSLPLEGRQQA